MSNLKLALASVGDLLRHEEVGEVINTHVYEHAKEPELDFEQMRKTISAPIQATEGLISLIQTRIPDLRVIVPSAAKSNGTLLGLAAKSIVMGATSELGPIEPQVQGIPCSILTDPAMAAQNLVLHRYGQFALQQS